MLADKPLPDLCNQLQNTLKRKPKLARHILQRLQKDDEAIPGCKPADIRRMCLWHLR